MNGTVLWALGLMLMLSRKRILVHGCVKVSEWERRRWAQDRLIRPRGDGRGLLWWLCFSLFFFLIALLVLLFWLFLLLRRLWSESQGRAHAAETAAGRASGRCASSEQCRSLLHQAAGALGGLGRRLLLLRCKAMLRSAGGGRGV